MRTFVRCFAFILSALVVQVFTISLFAQTAGSSGTVNVTVTDASGAVIPGATVTIENPVSGLNRKAISDATGNSQFTNLPLNQYHLSVSMSGFTTQSQDLAVRSTVPQAIKIPLQVGAAATTVTVTGSDLIEDTSSLSTDLDRDSFKKLPLESQSSGLSSLVTLSSPGVAADSNGLFHGLGDHASNSFAVDGQDITDQQSKVFSNQLPSNAVQSIKVIDGAPPAEYGDKTALIIDVTTRSGQGITTPTGSITSSYGTFGASTESFDLSYGQQNWGNFFEADGLNTSRFLDPPEFKVFHDRGNEENFFDRIDRTLSNVDSVHLNLNYSRSWFQNPNSYDNLNVQNVLSGGASDSPVIGNVGETDQKSKIETFNIAPLYTRIVSPNSVFNFGPYIRKDSYNYYPSANPLADRGPANLQTSSIQQNRTLTNAGVHTDISWTKGVNTAKAGARYEQTILRENDALGIVDPTYNAPCVDADGNPIAGYSATNECPAANPDYIAVLGPYDITRGGNYYHWFGHTDVKELALYVEDQIKAGNWLFNVGIRGDMYNGLTKASQAEPRVGLAYTIKQTNTVLRASYARTLETPFNENLVLSSLGCGNDVLSPLLACSPGVGTTMQPGYKNEFHAGLQQAFGKNLVISGDYIWKYTHNAFDFSVLGNTPITFPIDWHNSKIPGFALRADVPDFHHLSAYVVMSSVAARFFPQQVAGAGATVGQSGYPFRIDHDEKYNETTHVQYQIPGKRSPWVGFNWRYDSGLVAGSVPCYNTTDPNSACGGITLADGRPGIDLSGLTYDQQFEAGLTCDGVKATPTSGFTQCDANGLTSKLVKIPAPGTEDDDKNPPRIAPRNLFDLSLGQDNLFNGDRYKWSLRLTGTNITNKYALYNFLSTFSGTHYVSPRAMTAEVGFHF